jgi:hypothetical protein
MKEGIRVVTRHGTPNTNQVPEERATMDAIRRDPEESKKEDREKQGKG